MAKCARLIPLFILLLAFIRPSFAVDARFDLVGPRINMRVTRNGVTLPVAEVPNLQPGDRIWLHPDLPETQSVKYLLICAFLRGSTNPPPDDWFTRIETWQKNVREEGVFVTVPKEAQQAVLFLAPETGGDFSTLRSAVRGRPGIFVRASQDLAEAGFEQSRIERYLADIRRAPAGDPNALQKHSDLLARTLALKPNGDCFKQPVDTQFTCLTQTGSQSLLDDGHGQSIASALSNGANSDLIAAASYTAVAGGGLYSAYVGAIVDLVRVMANLHTAQYQYIPAIAFPQNDAMNLRLNTPPSFHNPKSVLVIGLPAVQSSASPPLRPADPDHVACLIEPSVTLPIEGAPLVFSTSLAHDLVLHLNTPPGAPAESDIPLVADAYHGGLVLQRTPEHHVPIHDVLHDEKSANNKPVDNKNPKPAKPQPEPIRLTGTIEGQWGFDSFTGPTVPLQQLPGGEWQIANVDASSDSSLIAGKSAQLLITSTGSACVHTITVQPRGSSTPMNIAFKLAPAPDQPNLLALTLPLEHDVTPNAPNLSIQQYGQPKADQLAARTFSEPAHINSVELHAADRTVLLSGQRLNEIERLALGDLTFKPLPPSANDATEPADATSLKLALPPDAPAPPTKVGDKLTARISLNDGRTLTMPVTVSAARPALTLLSKSSQATNQPIITLSSTDDLPLSTPLTFTLKTAQPFPRSGRVEIETLDGTLRAVLTLAPSGGLVLQDPHTVVATLDPLRAFGPSAFGALHFRAILPPRKHADEQAATNPATPDAEDGSSSDWLPLGTLVRLPQLATLQCPADPTASCTLSGSNLFLVDAIAPTPAFDNPALVPDGFTGSTLSVPHPASAGTLFLKLRDDPNPVDAANIPSPTPAPHATTTARLHHPGTSAASHLTSDTNNSAEPPAADAQHSPDNTPSSTAPAASNPTLAPAVPGATTPKE